MTLFHKNSNPFHVKYLKAENNQYLLRNEYKIRFYLIYIWLQGMWVFAPMVALLLLEKLETVLIALPPSALICFPGEAQFMSNEPIIIMACGWQEVEIDKQDIIY